MNKLDPHQQKRSGGLIIILFYLAINNSFTLIIFSYDNIVSQQPVYDFSSPINRAITVLSLVNLICVVGIYSFKRWGVYGIFITTILGIALSPHGFNVVNLIAGLTVPILLTHFLRNNWQAMD